MRFSRLAVVAIISLTVLAGSGCNYYNQIMARKSLVDGANAYKERKFDQAEGLFRDAVSRDPDGDSLEGRTAQLFLARTLHSEYIGNRSDKTKAEEAISEYQKALTIDIKDQSSYKAIANLLDNLGREDEALKWTTDRANNEQVPAEQRAEAFSSLAAKKNSCANDISDTEETKKTVTENGKQVFQFIKPKNPEDFTKLKQCAEEGLVLANRAVELDQNSDSAWSYKTSLLIQKMRVAEMEGNSAQEQQFKAQADEAKVRFTALADAKRKKEQEEEERKKAEAAAANKK